jgi:hypothetical protein
MAKFIWTKRWLPDQSWMWATDQSAPIVSARGTEFHNGQAPECRKRLPSPIPQQASRGSESEKNDLTRVSLARERFLEGLLWIESHPLDCVS